MIFNHNHAATITRRATRTRLAAPQDEHAIPLQQVNVPVLNLEWIKSRLSPATLERLMQVWGLVGRSPLPPSSSGKAREGSRRIPAADARLLKEAGIIEDASSTTTGGWIMPFSVVEEKTTAYDDDGSRGHATRTETTLTRLMFLFYTFPIICRL
ncbi:hypothetical protein C3747_36g310 [Trypanosoma cruzi]|uniref:Uncharacterized protein n=1 Tax=Trypanosoma cruzi TaxID=5693 RepID=A0A2V2X1S8_TRYCR|nr:hypothetical protein C3747_36g310 [Trypanosoma cruzi]RNC46456.1 target of rapamycin (TOR) kinase 1 [Trypanosoma cruzi]